ncbi:MAG: hypothetical protein WCV70_03220 [Patescibacteria group bacterium]|jgi:hypothetical protein
MKNKNITLKYLKYLYNIKRKSAQEIAKLIGCSPNRINYWLAQYKISKRTISDAIYIKHNPGGDPFKFVLPDNIEDAKLFGLGLGLYWGEGNKANKNTVRLGNSDPALLNKFIEFLIKFFNIKKKDLKFHLHVFSDIDVNEALDYWIDKLKISKKQFYKPMITISGSLGTYKNKSKFGVVTVYYGNIKLKNKLVELLPL